MRIPDGEGGLIGSWVDCSGIATIKHEFIDRIKGHPHLKDFSTMRRVEAALRYMLDARQSDPGQHEGEGTRRGRGAPAVPR